MLKKFIVLNLILIPFYVKGQILSIDDLERMVVLNKNNFHQFVLKKGYKFYNTFESPVKSGEIGKLDMYIFPNQTPTTLWGLIYTANGAIVYYPEKSVFNSLKAEIEHRFKYVRAVTKPSSQIVYETPNNRFHVVLDDGTGRRSINVFMGHGR